MLLRDMSLLEMSNRKGIIAPYDQVTILVEEFDLFFTGILIPHEFF
jgi:hypothetical protein